MIPETKKEAVIRALQGAFGVSEFEDIKALTAGLSSALVFRMVVKGRPYLMKIITRTDAMADPTKWFGCMKVAADAKLSPRVWYTSIEDRISITDFVEAKPFPLNESIPVIAEMLRRLHALPPFPKVMDYINTMGGFVTKLQNANMLPEGITEQLGKIYTQLSDTYPRNEEDMVSCYNDLKPENFIFDGKQPWLVDWEAAFLNDKYVDLAVVGNFIVTNDKEEADFLKLYFGEPASEYQHARFYLMRQIMHISYVAAFLIFANHMGKQIDMNTEVLDFREYHNRIWLGEITFADNEPRIMYARVHLKQVMQNIQTPRFKESLRIVSGS
ncbi:MAG TPA: phosphotransferase [Bacteroidia bacterium]|nr:phosphotransferase [Bacteroidia bacterium]